MEVVEYKGQNVYTSSLNRAGRSNLEAEGTKVETGIIEDAYFFTLSPDRHVERVDRRGFSRRKIESGQQDLMVDVKYDGWGTASVPIAGLERIASFMCDMNVLGRDLSELKGRKVTTYNRGIELLGIGIDI